MKIVSETIINQMDKLLLIINDHKYLFAEEIIELFNKNKSEQTQEIDIQNPIFDTRLV